MKGRPVEIKLKLKKKDKQELEQIARDNGVKAIIQQRAKALLELSKDLRPIDVGRKLDLHRTTVSNIRDRYQESGLEIALYGNPRSGRPKEITDKQKEELVAMVCSNPPEGYARWSLMLIASECQKRKIIHKISHEGVRKILNSHELKPWREKNVVRN